MSEFHGYRIVENMRDNFRYTLLAQGIEKYGDYEVWKEQPITIYSSVPLNAERLFVKAQRRVENTSFEKPSHFYQLWYIRIVDKCVSAEYVSKWRRFEAPPLPSTDIGLPHEEPLPPIEPPKPEPSPKPQPLPKLEPKPEPRYIPKPKTRKEEEYIPEEEMKETKRVRSRKRTKRKSRLKKPKYKKRLKRRLKRK